MMSPRGGVLVADRGLLATGGAREQSVGTSFRALLCMSYLLPRAPGREVSQSVSRPFRLPHSHFRARHRISSVQVQAAWGGAAIGGWAGSPPQLVS